MTSAATGNRGTMRRLLALIAGELRFSARYGILALYGLLVILYILLLSATAAAARPSAAGVVILTDPAAMGLFFMGAMILLEKSQRVNCAMAVSPVRVWEYIFAKAFTLMAIGLLVALAVGAYAGLSLTGVCLSVIPASTLFTMLGMMVASRSDSLNRFLLLSIPVELVAFVPAMFYWFGGLSGSLWIIHPGVAALVPLSPDTAHWGVAFASLVFWNIVVYPFCLAEVRRNLRQLGGGRL